QPKLSPVTHPGKAGMSSETLLFDMSWRDGAVERQGRFVARLPPPPDAFPLFPSYDFDLQVGVMRLVGGRSRAPAPRVLWQERSAEPLGAPFFVMERIEGEVVPDNPPYVFAGWLSEASPAQQALVQQQLIDVLAEVHGVAAAPAETAFLQLEHPGESPLRRHFARERAYYDWGRSGLRFPLVEALCEWLERHWPEREGEPVVSWGDARPANILWRDFRATAVLDWEKAVLLPREFDVGYLIFFHKYFRHIAARMAGLDAMPGFLRRDEVVAAYQRLTGVRLHDIDWYIAYALLQQALVEIRISQRRIYFGEWGGSADPNDYLFSRNLIEQLLAGQSISGDD
ncbi:MAG TPA: phosphotransferase family protein, partial [Steroidobacter sp.]|nr:phosphotransferase family protein [Steroidobacter sp.]